MEFLFNEFVKLRAKRERITEGEAYLRYAERTDKRLAHLIKPKKIKIEKEDKDLLL